jgi:hypothetical protein
MSGWALLVVAVATAGCSRTGAVVLDLSVSANDLAVSSDADLAVSLDDLAVLRDAGVADLAKSVDGPADFAGVCRTDDAAAPIETVVASAACLPLAGTCAAEFWDQLVSCFKPAGCCVSTGSVHHPGMMWTSGAAMGLGPWGPDWWSQGGKLCGSIEGGVWTGADGRTWVYDSQTGVVICPGPDAGVDGGQANLGAGCWITLRLSGGACEAVWPYSGGLYGTPQYGIPCCKP